MTDRELLELIAAQVGNLTNEVEEVKAEVRSTKQTVIRIENDHGKKLTALYDGYQQMNQRLDRIEQEVARHEEIIWKRVK